MSNDALFALGKLRGRQGLKAIKSCASDVRKVEVPVSSHPTGDTEEVANASVQNSQITADLEQIS